MLKIYNTLSKQKELFIPIDSNHIKMYVCGPTVYDDIHIGNARPIVIFDTIYKTLQHLYPKVTYVRNITDIDDKILTRAQENNESISSLTNRTIKSLHETIQDLNVSQPTYEPKATEHIEDIIIFIKKLISNGYAYEKDGSVFFDVSKYSNYGQLSGLEQETLRHNVRIQNDVNKNNPADFVLWKPTLNEPSITKDIDSWNSPWGYGRPGWHIECSAMANKYLGHTFDIHGGGKDLIFPHHENEIAQSEACNNCILANYWLHNGWMTLNGEKMSKSTGNFITLKKVLQKYSGEVVRLTLLRTHYRQPLAFTEEALEQSVNILHKLYKILAKYNILISAQYHNILEASKMVFSQSKFMQAICDDFNTPLAIQRFQHKIMQIDEKYTSADQDKIIQMAYILGILQNINMRQHPVMLDSHDINALIDKRTLLKQNKNFAAADQIRQQLLDMGIVLEDHPHNTTWRVK